MATLYTIATLFPDDCGVTIYDRIVVFKEMFPHTATASKHDFVRAVYDLPAPIIAEYIAALDCDGSLRAGMADDLVFWRPLSDFDW